MEECSVCAGSFTQGRGLRIHQAKSRCKSTLERRRIFKSTKGSPQDKHHSGATKAVIPEEPASETEASRREERESIKKSWSKDRDITDNRQSTIMSSDTNTRTSNRHDPLELSTEKRENDDSVLVVDDEIERKIRKSVLETLQEKPKRRVKRTVKKGNQVKSMDIRQFVILDGKKQEPRSQLFKEDVKVEKEIIEQRVVWKKEYDAQYAEDDRVVIKEDVFNLRDNTILVQESPERTVLNVKQGITEVSRNIDVFYVKESPDRTIVMDDCLIISDDEESPKRKIIREDPILFDEEARPEDSRSVNVKQGRQDIRQWFKTKDSNTMPSDTYKNLVENLNSGPLDDILSKHILQMRRRDYRSLSGKNYLNDKIIDEYFSLIAERNAKQKKTKVHSLCSYMFPKLEQDFDTEFEVLNQWIKVDLTEYDIILVPIHKDDHWTLISLAVQEKMIYYYDSILGTRKSSSAPRVFRKFFERYFERRGKDNQFKIKIMENAPLQKNGYDCGVFTCQNAEKIARGVAVNTRQEEIPSARRSMMLEIFSGSLSTDTNHYLQNFIKKSTLQTATKKQVKRVTTEVKKTQTPVQSKKSRTSKQACEVTESRLSGTKGKIKWPKSNSSEWDRLDNDLTALLRIIYSPPDKKAVSHPKIIYEMCKERFGLQERKARRVQGGPSRRQRTCKSLREEIGTLKQAYNEAPVEEKEAIQELNREKLRKLRLLKRAESIKKNRKKFSSNCHEFLSQPYQFSRNVLSPKPKGNLESSKEEVEAHLKAAHSNQRSGTKQDHLSNLQEYDEPDTSFDDGPPSYRQFLTKLKRTRSKSSPGPNGVPYLVYKRCPGVSKQLWSYLRELWRRNTMSDTWREAEGVFIPKEEGAKTVDKFRTISLLNVEGKLFFSLKADRITSFLMKNKFIDPSIQKGGIPGVSGCLEHTAILSQLISEAKKERRNLVVTWLDIANAYGSIPHNIIRIALERAHVPEKTRSLIDSYYKNVKIRFTTRDFTTDWQRVEKGIITGCTLSVVLFALTMSWLVESVKKDSKGPTTSTGQRQVNSRLFMDDITTTTETVPQTKYLLASLSEKLNWAGLRIKPEKCRSLVIIKGNIQKRDIKIDEKVITSIQDMPVKYLGKQYNASLGEKDQIKLVEYNLKSDLKKIERCKIPGRYKCWIVQHMLIPKMMWPLNIYNIPLSKIEELQKKITGALKRWLKIPKSFSTDCLYSTSTKLRLSYSSLTEEYRASKARNQVTLDDSKDPCIHNAGISVDAGRKANTPAEVKEARTRLQMKEITGIANQGKEGLGMRKRQYYSTSSKKVRRDMVVQTVRDKEEEKRMINMTGLSKQGTNLKWEVPQRHLTQATIINTPEASFSFLVKAVYDLLPTPANKSKWFNKDERCMLCGGQGTLNHLLSGCKVALSQGRYKWRHDKVLKVISSSIEQKLLDNLSAPEPTKKTINFVREGEKSQKSNTDVDCYLSSAKDWKMSVDLENSLQVPKEVTLTNLRPDITLTSRKTKQMGIVELTVPSEERIEVSGELKRHKYEKIAQEGRMNGWRVKIWAVEVGCKGFPAASLAFFLKEIGYKGSQRKRTIEKIGKAAEYASHSIWKASHFKTWGSKK